MPTFATLTEYELNRAAALTRRDGRTRWVEVGTGRIHTHRPADAEVIRVQQRGAQVVYAHQHPRD
jgi:hypothetical protein